MEIIVDIARNVDEAGRLFCHGCWGWLKAFAFLATLTFLLKVALNNLCKIGDDK